MPALLDRLAADLFHKPAPTSDLVLTIDARVHDAAVGRARRLERRDRGASIRAPARCSRWSRRRISTRTLRTISWQSRTIRTEPLFNRALQATYVPGSTFKTVTASAAVDSGAVDLQAPFLCTTAVKIGTYSVDCKNSQHVPRLSYQQAFAWSSNRVFGLTGLCSASPTLADQRVARRRPAGRLSMD